MAEVFGFSREGARRLVRAAKAHEAGQLGRLGSWTRPRYPGQVAPEGAQEFIRFEMLANMSITATSALARPIGSTSTTISDDDTFYVLNPEARFVGKVGFTDGDTSAEVHPGYQGTALFTTNDWAETGKTGWTIVEMEQPDAWLAVKIVEADPTEGWRAYIQDAISAPARFGQPYSWRRPRILDDDYDIIVYESLVANPYRGAGPEQHWLARYDEKNDRYILFLDFQTPYEIAVFTSSGEATWDADNNERTNATSTAYPIIVKSTDPTKDEIDFTRPISLKNVYPDPWAVDSTYMRTGWAMGVKVMILSCSMPAAPDIPE